MVQIVEQKVRVPALTAQHAAENFMGDLSPFCQRMVIAGSLRRMRPHVGDIELVCIPEAGEVIGVDLFGEALPSPIDRLTDGLRQLINDGIFSYRLNDKGQTMFGPLNKYLVHNVSGIKVDIFTTTFENWGQTLFIRTGPAQWNMGAMTRLRELGMEGHVTRPITRDGKDLLCPTEEHVFDLLGWKYVEPWHRDGNSA